MIRPGPSSLLTRIRERLASERGFTLVEVLVTVIIIGVLAAIAYALFIGQRSKAKDAESKNNVAGLAVAVESCRVDRDDFTRCDSTGEIDEVGLPIDSAASLDGSCSSVPATGPNPSTPPEKGKVAVVASEVDCYVALSQTVDGHFFWLWHRPDGTRDRRCTPAGQGSCNVDPSSPPTIGTWN